MKNQVFWYEIPVEDMNRAKLFYSNVFGFNLSEVHSSGGQMVVFDGNSSSYGASGCLVEKGETNPSENGTLVYFSCKDIDDTLELIDLHNGHVILVKRDIGENGYYAHFIDTEGNRMGLYSPKR
jgi:predicted enzyme related to lactoylglutathione lyase